MPPPPQLRYMSAVSQAVVTPCLRVCAVDGRTGLCLGCGRTLREIAGWGGLAEEQRRAIMAGLDERMRAAGLTPPPPLEDAQ